MPIDINTHRFSPDHFHTDLAYGFVATAEPHLQPLEDESLDLRWLTVTELKAAAARGEAIEDIVPLYECLVNDYVNNWQLVDPLSFFYRKFWTGQCLKYYQLRALAIQFYGNLRGSLR